MLAIGKGEAAKAGEVGTGARGVTGAPPSPETVLLGAPVGGATAAGEATSGERGSASVALPDMAAAGEGLRRKKILLRYLAFQQQWLEQCAHRA